MILQAFEAGPVETVGYLVADERSGEGVIVDVPMQSLGSICAFVHGHDLSVRRILLTHGHFDHVGDVRALAAALDAKVSIHEADAPMLAAPSSSFPGLSDRVEGMTADSFLEDAEIVECGSLRFRVIHAPGHTRGHVVLYEMQHNILFSGDVLFHSSIGRTDLPGGDYEALMQSITGTILKLPVDTIVYPGHGPSTTIGFEREHNPFILEYLDHF